MAATTVEITKALEAIWEALRGHHSSLPPAALAIVGRASDNGGAIDAGPRVSIAENVLADGARKTFEALAHQAAHALAQARGLADTSGRYHNSRFEALAEELGLTVGGRTDKFGWADVTVSDAMAERYRPALETLERLLAGYVVHAPPRRDASQRPRGKARRDQIKARCKCRSFRISEALFKIAPIHCQGCGQDFRAA